MFDQGVRAGGPRGGAHRLHRSPTRYRLRTPWLCRNNEADLIVARKSLGGGLPLVWVARRAELLDSPAPGGLGGTFGGNPAACTAVCAVLDLLPGLLPRARALGEILRAGLERIAPAGAGIRALGPMLALELPERVRRARRG
jgi:4-aminobutyrate aminotransferase/(S)-3-amino-2-methylpropionate transaminase